MKQVVIFGVSDVAQLAHFYFTHDSQYKVVAFCVDEKYRSIDDFFDLPVVSFESIEKTHSFAEYDMFVALGYSSLNMNRTKKCQQARKKGYKLVSYISSKATLWPDFQCGDNCFILEDNTIQPFVTIGNNVILWSGNHIGHHAEIQDNCFVASHAVISGKAVIGENCFIGVNATIRNNVIVRKNTVVGAGALILRDTKEGGVYMGSATKFSGIISDQLEKI